MRTFDGFLHGVNLGGWLSQTNDFSTAHFEQFITEQDIAYIASLNLDHVRVPIDYMLLEEEDGTKKQEGYHYLDQCLSWCKQYGLHMIIDLQMLGMKLPSMPYRKSEPLHRIPGSSSVAPDTTAWSVFRN